MIPYYNTPGMRQLMFGTVVTDGDSIPATATEFNVFIPELMFDRVPSATPTPVPIKNIFKSTENIHTNSSVKSQNFITIPTSDAFRQMYKHYDSNGPKRFQNGDRVAIYINNFDIDDAMIVPF